MNVYFSFRSYDMAKRPIINFKVPKAGRITTGRIVGVAVCGMIVIAAWNWSDRIPGVGKYAAVGKYYVAKALGVQFSVKPVIL